MASMDFSSLAIQAEDGRHLLNNRSIKQVQITHLTTLTPKSR